MIIQVVLFPEFNLLSFLHLRAKFVENHLTVIVELIAFNCFISCVVVFLLSEHILAHILTAFSNITRLSLTLDLCNLLYMF